MGEMGEAGETGATGEDESRRRSGVAPSASASPMPAAAPATRRADLRRRQTELARELVLDVAEELFAERGYAGTTMRQIADAAGFAVATVYEFVAGKEELVAAIMDRHGARLVDLHEQVLRD